MPNYFIRVDGQSRTDAQLMDMLVNQALPERIEIVGILNAENPESKQWTFSRDGEMYRMTKLDINLGGAGLLRAGVNDGHFVRAADLADSVQEAIEFFGPDGVAVNAPPMNQPARMNMLMNQNAPMNMLMNNNVNMGFGQPGGRRRRTMQRKRKTTHRRRASQRRRTQRRRF
jgi:hypothetical protein